VSSAPLSVGVVGTTGFASDMNLLKRGQAAGAGAWVTMTNATP
jgi:hypothetical protein